MYYRSARKALRKMLCAGKVVIIRSYFAEANYRILRGQSNKNNDKVLTGDDKIFDSEGNFQIGDYWTIYSHNYIEHLVREIDSKYHIFWVKDDSGIMKSALQDEKDRGVVKRYAAEVIGDYEISYPILQPWETVVITRKQ